MKQKRFYSVIASLAMAGVLLIACQPEIVEVVKEVEVEKIVEVEKEVVKVVKEVEEVVKIVEVEVDAGPKELADVPRDKTVVVGWWGSGVYDDFTLYNPFGLGFNYQTGPHVVWEGLAYWSAFTDETTMWQAEGYSYNDDFTELTINLRPEVRWSDGMPFTAQDVVYTIQTLKDLNGAVRFSDEVAQFTESVEAVDSNTVLIKMTMPAPRYFFRFFVWKWDSGAFPIVPKHIYEGKDWSAFQNFDLDKGWPVTTAAFGVVYSDANQKLFDARDEWWAYDAGLVDGTLPMDRVAYPASGSDKSSQIQMLVDADIDITEVNVPAAIELIERTENVTFHYGRKSPYGYSDWWAQALHPNHASTISPVGNKDVRWAMSYYIDREQIIDIAMQGASAPSRMPFPPYAGLLKYIDSIDDLLEEYNTIENNPAKGDALLEGAGYSRDGDDNWVDSSGEPLTIVFNNWDYWTPWADVVVEQLRQNGITVDYQTPPDVWDRFSAGDYDGVFPAGHAGSLKDPYEAMALYSCARVSADGVKSWSSNATGWCNDDFDDIVLEMAQTNPADEETMFALFRDAMEIWLPELPSIQLFDWMHNMAMGTTYWDCWPTSEGSKGEYVNEAPQLLGFDLVLWNLCPAG